MKFFNRLLLVALLAVTPASGDFVVLQGLQHQLYSLSLKIQNSLIPEIARGVSTPTYARATIATGQDFEGLNKRLLSGEPRFPGARRVYNLLEAGTDITVSANWTKSGTGDISSSGGGVFVIFGLADSGDSVLKHGTQGTSILNRSAKAIAYIKATDGENVGKTLRLRIARSSGGSFITTFVTVTLTADYVLWTTSILTGSEAAQIDFRFDILGSPSNAASGCTLKFPMLEEVTGQSNQNPSTPISVDLLSAPFHGANIDGVQYFLWANGNTVIDGVVTETRGAFFDATDSFNDVDGPYGYLAEAARANVVLHSESLDDAVWTIANITVDNEVSRGPDGRLTADRINVVADANIHSITDTQLTNTSGRSVAFSTSVKFDGEQYIFLNLQTSAEDHISANYDVQGGIVDTTDTGTTSGTITKTSIRPERNGYYRLELVGFIAEAAALNWTIGSGGSAGPSWGASGRVSFTPSAGEDFFLTNVQVEDDATFASSYIPTVASSATRNKDDLTYAAAGNASYPLTARLEYTPTQITSIGVLLDINDGTADERVEISVTTAGKPRLLVRVSAGDVVDITADDALVVDTTYSITAVIELNDARLYVNGVETGTADTSLALPATPTIISIGQDYNAANQPFGTIRNITIVPSPWGASRIAQ